MNEIDGISVSSESMYKILKDEILNLTLKPGQNISENELCSRFNVSRTPVRSAISRLQADGLVNVIPYKSSTVAPLNYDDICQTIYMRIAVESAVIEDFLMVSTPMLEEKIRYNIRKQIVLLNGDFDPSDFYILDSRLHEIWFSAVKRKKLWEMIQRSQINYTRFRMLDISTSQNFKQIIEEHEEIFNLILNKNSKPIKSVIEKHLNGGITRLSERIKTDFKDYFQSE